MTFKKFKLNDINPIGVVYFILVLALLIIVTNQGKMNRTLQSDILEVQQQFTSATQKYLEDLTTAEAQLKNAQKELSLQITGLEQDLEILEKKLTEKENNYEKKLTEKDNNYSTIVRQKNYQIDRNSLIVSDLKSKIEGYESQLKIAQTQLEIVQSSLATTTEALTNALENPVCPTTTCPDTQ